MPLLVHSFDYPPNDGGIARLCSEIVSLYRLAGVNVEVLSQKSVQAERQPAVAEVRVGWRRPWRELEALRELRRRRNCVVLCGLWYPEALLALLARVRQVVVLAHGAELMPGDEQWRQLLWPTMQRRVLESVSLVVANSSYTRDLVQAAAPAASVVSVPLGVDHVHFSPGDRAAARRRLGLEQGTVLCSVSRLHEYKGHSIVLRAIASLPPAERESLVYLVAGKGPAESNLRNLADDLNIRQNLRWLGYVSEAELPGIYRASDLFVLCSRQEPQSRCVEGFGLAFLEAQACGTPVVGTRTGGIPDAVKDGEGGWLIEADDCAALGAILRNLIRSPESFASAGRLARRRVEHECTWNRYFENLSSALAQKRIEVS